MNVAFFNFDDGNGGAAKACKRLISALEKNSEIKYTLFLHSSYSDQKNHKVVKKGYWGKLTSRFSFILDRLQFLFYEKNKNVRFAFSTGKIGLNIKSNICLAQFDIIHLHWINFGFLSLDDLQFIFKLGKPVIWTMHDMWSFTGGCHYSGICENFSNNCSNCNQFLKSPSNHDLSNYIFKRKKQLFEPTNNLYLVACSNWLKSQSDKSSLLKSKRCVSIPNPISSNVYHPINKAQAQAKLNLDPNKSYILIVAMNVLDKRKGFDFLIKSLDYLYAQLTANNCEIPEFLVIGKFKNYNIEDISKFKFNFLGSINDDTILNIAYNAANLFITPSLEDNLPNTIMESMACGTPCVAFNIGGIPEMIDHQINGYLSQSKDPEDLANGISWILNSKDYDQLSKACLEKVEANYNEKLVANKYLELYNQVLQN